MNLRWDQPDGWTQRRQPAPVDAPAAYSDSLCLTNLLEPFCVAVATLLALPPPANGPILSAAIITPPGHLTRHAHSGPVR